MKASELVSLLQKKIERYGDWDVCANGHPVSGVHVAKLATRVLISIVFDEFTHDITMK